ncbi:MAG: DUF507 family protein [Bdellovibrionales bacterium]|nr:DUF507 family protein [Bdellovibrionales bacterium]
MMISEDRQSHFARILVDGIWNDDLVDFTDDEAALRAAKKGISQFVRDIQEIDKKVREKIASLSRGVVDNSSEWEVLYNKYFEEESARRGTKK